MKKIITIAICLGLYSQISFGALSSVSKLQINRAPIQKVKVSADGKNLNNDGTCWRCLGAGCTWDLGNATWGCNPPCTFEQFNISGSGGCTGVN